MGRVSVSKNKVLKCMRDLCDSDGNLSMSNGEIAEITGIGLSTVSRVVASLVQDKKIQIKHRGSKWGPSQFFVTYGSEEKAIPLIEDIDKITVFTPNSSKLVQESVDEFVSTGEDNTDKVTNTKTTNVICALPTNHEQVVENSIVRTPIKLDLWDKVRFYILQLEEQTKSLQEENTSLKQELSRYREVEKSMAKLISNVDIKIPDEAVPKRYMVNIKDSLISK